MLNAIFTVVERVLLTPLPYPAADRIVRVAATVYPSKAATADRGNTFSPAGYWHFANHNRADSSLFSGSWSTGKSSSPGIGIERVHSRSA